MKSTVVVGYDQTPPSERALVQAAREAAWRGGSLTVVHAFDWMTPRGPGTYIPAGVEESISGIAQQIADHGAELVHSRFPNMPVEAKAIPGGAAEALTATARGAGPADLLVVGNRGRGGFASLLLGSVSMRALSGSCVPTMVVRGEHRDPHDAVLVAVDVEEPADDLMRFAFDEAARRGARLEAVTVWDLSWAADYAGDTADIRRAAAAATADLDAALEALVHTWHGKYPDVRVSHRVADGVPAAVLTDATSHADLIVAGARRHGDGRHGMRIGPIAHALVHHAQCPVVVVPRD